MNMSSAGAQPGFEPIPGYVLREKLGAGGYGEVWLADAPGGLKKAIKFVHGSIDGERASHELKSLQRIRQVNHPFILSLERIEVIENQLVIVTELAQGTLLDRFTEFRQRGFIGIPRDRLLSYLRDAADGLDFLCQQHDLQHLDVKPGNLLLIADRVKVADFGLIKDVQAKSLSIMGGLTPTYAAPEMFDGRPGRFSDQYSLAIVYQELLTGTLPFRGRTTAQLANEHLHKAPNLESIPLHERPILSKALSKKPQVRFSDCREFISALERVQRPAEAEPTKAKIPTTGKTRLLDGSQVVPDRSSKSESASKSISRGEANSIMGAASTHENRTVNILSFPELPTTEPKLAAPSDGLHGKQLGGSPNPVAPSRRTLVIGLGETGAETLLATRQQFAGMESTFADLPNVRWLLIDSDQNTINMATDSSRPEHLPFQSVQLIHLNSPIYYRHHQSSQFPQLSRRWVYNIPRSLKTEGVRPLGMLAFLDHAASCYATVGRVIVDLVTDLRSSSDHEPLSIYIVASAHGGTGGAIANEIGFLVRQIAAEIPVDVEIELILTCAAPQPCNSNGVEIGSAMACLIEINHYFRTGGLHPAIENIPHSQAVDKPPFDRVNLVYGGQYGFKRDWDRTIHQCSEYLTACIGSVFGKRMLDLRKFNEDTWKDVPDREWTDWLGTLSVRTVELNAELDSRTLAERQCLWTIQQWIELLSQVRKDENQKRYGVGVDNKKNERIDFVVSDLFRYNRWTAQAWVMRCMNTMLPKGNDSKTDLGTTQTNNEPAALVDLTFEQRNDVEHICDLLALDADDGCNAVANLMDSERLLLMRWLSEKWLSDTNGWECLTEILKSLSSKFSVNANSLTNVAKTLGDKHDELLDEMYGNTEPPTKELDKQLHTIALETRFHSMASRILSRLATHVQHLENIWSNEANLFLNDLVRLRATLAEKLDLRIDANGLPRDFCEFMSNQESITGLCHIARESMVKIAIHRVASSWGIVNQINPIDEWITRSPKPLELLTDFVADQFRKHLPGVSSDDESMDQNSKDPSLSTHSFSNESSHSTQFQGTSNPSNFSSSQSNRESKTGFEKTPTRTTGILVATQEVAEETNPANSLLIEFDRTRPYLVEFGGGIRNFLILPIGIDLQIVQLYSLQAAQRSAMVLYSATTSDTQIVSLGEQLILSELIDRLWTPSQDLWNLAERLLARVDIDWNAIN